MATEPPLDMPSIWQNQLLQEFMREIFVERVRAHRKHGKTSMEQSGPLEHRRASILMEEAAECGRALNDHEHGEIHLAEKLCHADAGVHGDKLDDELIETGAMAYTWWANRRGDQLPPPVEPVTYEDSDPRLAEVIRIVRVIAGVESSAAGRDLHQDAVKVLKGMGLLQ